MQSSSPNTIPVVVGTPLPPPVATPTATAASSSNQPCFDAAGNPVPLPHNEQDTNLLPSAPNGGMPMDPSTLTSLRQQGFTTGLAHALQTNQRAFPLAIWVVDNSGSMNHRDGHKLVETGSSAAVRVVECTRWAEMVQTVQYHAQLAALLQSPTMFRLLNHPGRVAGPQYFNIAYPDASAVSQQLSVAHSVVTQATPGGATPLVPHLHAIRQDILRFEPQLRRDGTKVALILATDGLPSDDFGRTDRSTKQEFVEALRSFEGLPVWIVVRLCTDEDDVVEFWNTLDNQLELSLEVLDDWQAEAQEIHDAGNAWLNYGLPLHRMRELGFYSKLFDMLDERTLGKDELRDFMCLLFGVEHMDGLPDPQADWKGFLQGVQRLNQTQGTTWNPMSKRVEPWIDMRKLKSTYGTGGGWFW